MTDPLEPRPDVRRVETAGIRMPPYYSRTPEDFYFHELEEERKLKGLHEGLGCGQYMGTARDIDARDVLGPSGARIASLRISGLTYKEIGERIGAPTSQARDLAIKALQRWERMRVKHRQLFP